MQIFLPAEMSQDDLRVCLIPQDVRMLVDKGLSVFIEKGLGQSLFSDRDYLDAGAQIVDSFEDGIAQTSVIVRKFSTEIDHISKLKKGMLHISFLDTFTQKDVLDQFHAQNVRVLSLQLIPRSTIAQKMDVLSSQASLAGYVAVMEAAQRVNKVFPMMVTPSGTLSPVRVFVIGVGVAGLQAIATAKRLGARVEAFDTRPAVEEQVKSLGAKFVKVDLGDSGETKDGYAKALTDEQLNKQRDIMKRHCASSDVVITTAQVFGRKAPIIVTDDMLKDMQPGSLVIDLAVESGGNVEGVQANQLVDIHNTQVLGMSQAARYVPMHASQMLSSNIRSLLHEFWDSEKESFDDQRHSEVLDSAIISVEEAVT